MTQARLDWTREADLPIAGKSVHARHASSTGAAMAARDRSGLALAYLALLDEAGPLSDEQAARALGRRLSSICSTRNGCGELVVPSGQYEEVRWSRPGELFDRRTKRVKWMRAQ